MRFCADRAQRLQLSLGFGLNPSDLIPRTAEGMNELVNFQMQRRVMPLLLIEHHLGKRDRRH